MGGNMPEFKPGDLIEIINAVNPAYHAAGDIEIVWGVDADKNDLVVPDHSGGVTHYKFSDVVLYECKET